MQNSDTSAAFRPEIEGHDGDCPPPYSPPPGEWAVERLLFALTRAARRVDVPFEMVDVLEFLLFHAGQRGDLRLSDHQRDTLLGAMAWARGPVLGLFRTPAQRARAVKGFDAAASMICILAESDDQRAARHQHVWEDIRDHARWLRNALDNLDIERQVGNRAAERRATVVSEIMRKAIAA